MIYENKSIFFWDSSESVIKQKTYKTNFKIQFENSKIENR